MHCQKGVVALIAPLFLLIAGVAFFFILVSLGVITNPLKTTKEPTVTLQKQYDNPLDKSSQFVNPFSSYQNPFDSLK